MKNTDSAKGNEASEGASSTPGAVDTTEKGTDATAETQIVPEVVVGHGDERESEPYTPGEIVEPKANWPVFLLSALGIAIIVAGAFAGLDEIIGSRAGRKGIGFGAPLNHLGAGDVTYADVRPEDLLKFGLIPEFIGRLPIIAHVDDLDRDSMVRVLTEPKNSLVKQYQRLFAMDGAELTISDDALGEIADKAAERKTGARGLRAIMEELLVPVMYELPDREDVAEVVVTGAVVRGEAEPEFLAKDEKATA